MSNEEQENVYRAKDPQKFDEILSIVQKQKLCVHTFMKSKCDLLVWMQDVVNPNIRKFPEYSSATLVYWIVNGLQDYPKCANKNCNNLIIKNVQSFKNGFDKFCCRSCSTSDENTKALHEKTSLDRHGEKYFTNRPKAMETTLANHGCKCGFQSKRALQSMKDRYGVEYYAQSEMFPIQSEATMLDRYGVKNIQELPEVHERSKQKAIELYGTCNNHAQCEKTMQERHGVKCNFQLPEHRQMLIDRKDEFEAKKRQSLKKHFGVEHAPTRKYIFEGIRFDSGSELAYYIWLRDQGINFTYRPDLCYTYQFDGKEHRYFPDFIVEGEVVEIKGDQFFEDKDPSKRMICPFCRDKDDAYEAKHQCMIQNGVKILTSKDYILYVRYVEEKYGKEYLKSFLSK